MLLGIIRRASESFTILPLASPASLKVHMPVLHISRVIESIAGLRSAWLASNIWRLQAHRRPAMSLAGFTGKGHIGRILGFES